MKKINLKNISTLFMMAGAVTLSACQTNNKAVENIVDNENVIVQNVDESTNNNDLTQTSNENDLEKEVSEKESEAEEQTLEDTEEISQNTFVDSEPEESPKEEEFSKEEPSSDKQEDNDSKEDSNDDKSPQFDDNYYSNPLGVVARLDAAQSHNQLIVVAASGVTAKVSMYEKISSEEWTQLIDTNGYVGSHGVGKASEYDSKTPAGIFGLRIAFGVNGNPGTALSYTKVDDSYYWVDDTESKYYNKFVSLNNTEKDWNSAEHIVDYPDSYAYAIAIDYNLNCVSGAGSAIFLHCSNGSPTLGCVSVPQSQMIRILQNIQPGCAIIIDTGENIRYY